MDPVRVLFGKIEFVPDFIMVGYQSIDGGHWEVYAAIMRGTRLLKSGETSDVIHANKYESLWRLKDAPQWFREFAIENMPREGQAGEPSGERDAALREQLAEDAEIDALEEEMDDDQADN
jgi:hypothetical protein